jgi:AraC family transcriptional regulator
MEKLSSGEFFGVTNQKMEANGLILTNTAYTHEYVDWHHHENAYFTFLLAGKMIEVDRKEKKFCSPGSLLFHHVEDSHYNIKPKGYTRGMHIELQPSWIKDNDPVLKTTGGSFAVTDANVKIIFYNILKEASNKDDVTLLGIEGLVVNAIDHMFPALQKESKYIPHWIEQAAALLQDNFRTPHSLKQMAKILGIHPVHLSRSFKKHFGCTIANYIRKIRVERALAQVLSTKTSLGYIAYDCGFADQSHMIRSFREFIGITPAQFGRTLTY